MCPGSAPWQDLTITPENVATFSCFCGGIPLGLTQGLSSIDPLPQRSATLMSHLVLFFHRAIS